MSKSLTTDLAHTPVPSPTTSAHIQDSSSSLRLPWIPESLSQNPYFSAGFALVGVGAILSLARHSAQLSFRLAYRHLLTSLEIPSRDASYSWVMQWLVSKNRYTRHLGVETSYVQDPSGQSCASFSYIPSTGRHFLNFHNRLLIIDRDREKSIVDLSSGSPWESVTLTTLFWDRKIFEKVLQEAKSMALKKSEGLTLIFHSYGQEWRQCGRPKSIRPFDSVILSEGVSDAILSDVKEFLSKSKWYFDRGIPYRRGYLLHGPPGGGKSSFVMALAGEMKYNICVINVSDRYLTDDRLLHLMLNVPPKTLLLLEDIDAGIFDSEIQDPMSESQLKTANSTPSTISKASPLNPPRMVTFSGLLNALDGVTATEERIIFMTTNFVERLPHSLIRPGRVDVKIHIGYASTYQLRQMFLRFFPGNDVGADSFTDILKPLQISMAELQGFFLFCKDDAEAALTLAKQWVKSTVTDVKRTEV